ncbi:MAG: hypothetical protein ACYC5M_16830 [Anaerolineae bacterium]
MKARFIGIVILVIALGLLSGCSTLYPEAASSDTGGSTPEAAATSSSSKAEVEATPTTEEVKEEPTDTPEPIEEEPTEASGEALSEEALGIADSEMLSTFSSYRMANVITWEMEDGTTNSFNMLTEFVREPAAQRIVLTGSPEAGEEEMDMEVIQIGDATYMRMGGDEWMALQSEDSMVSEDASWFADPNSLVDAADAKYVGTETVNGYPSKHYAYEETNLGSTFGMEVVDHVQSDIWVSTELGIATKIVVSYEGTDADGLKGTWSIESNLTDVNGDIVIEPPEGVAAPGLPDDIPMLADATEVNAFGTMVTYKVPVAPDEAVEGTISGMESNGWAYNADSSMSPDMLSFDKDGRTAMVYITAEDAGGTSITVMLSEE